MRWVGTSLVWMAYVVGLVRVVQAEPMACLHRAGTLEPAATVSLDGERAVSVDVNLTVEPAKLLSAEMRIEASLSGVLRVIGGAYGPDWDTYWAHATPRNVVLDTRSEPFGALPIGVIDRPDEPVLLATLDLQVLPTTPPGQYTLLLTEIIVGDRDTYQALDVAPGPPFTLTVVRDKPTVPTTQPATSPPAATTTQPGDAP